MDVKDGPFEAVSEPRIGRSVSLDHAARLLGVSRRTIYNRIRDGRLQTIRTLGGSQRVLVDSLQPTQSHAVDVVQAEQSGTGAVDSASLCLGVS
jgi:excisionase family DNA binding protein